VVHSDEETRLIRQKPVRRACARQERRERREREREVG
jgi:hypothetical protein